MLLTNRKVNIIFQSPYGQIVALLLMQGYKLVDPPLVSKLTNAQKIFCALAEQQRLETLLSPYIDRTPSGDALFAEEMRIGELDKKFAGKTDIGTKSWF